MSTAVQPSRSRKSIAIRKHPGHLSIKHKSNHSLIFSPPIFVLFIPVVVPITFQIFSRIHLFSLFHPKNKMIIKKKRRLEGELVSKYDRVIPKEESLKMVCGAFYLPKDNALKPKGEDAYFLCAEKQAIGVADGVGGWAKKGVDAGEYVRELMNNAFIAIHQQPNGVVDPKSVLNEAFLNTEAEGSSTACIAMLKDNILHSVNVGDSGFMIFRDNKLVYQSPIQQRYFNTPYQLGNGEKSDRPSSGIETTVEVVPGDIIVLGTDGLSDNAYPAEIEDFLKQETLEGVDPWHLASTITVDLALYNSLDKCSYSPFARAAQLAGKKRIGGKIDDITVVVAHIFAQN